MKINKSYVNKTKLIELKFLKTKIYKKNYTLNLDNLTAKLKTILKIIYKYHSINKKILFVGTPLKIHNKLELLIKKTKHTIIPEGVWVNGILNNKHFCFKYLIKQQSIKYSSVNKILLQIRERADLIVIFNQNKNKLVMKELATTLKPIIVLDDQFTSDSTTNSISDYVINGDFSFTYKKKRDNFFYSLLKATLKRTKQINKKK